MGRTDVASLVALGRFGSLVETIDEDILVTILGMSSLIVLVTIRSFALSSGRSAGSGHRSDGSRKGSSREAGQQGSEQQHRMVYSAAHQ